MATTTLIPSTIQPSAGPGRRHGERGAALLLTFLLMLVFAGMALGVAMYSHNSQAVGANQLQDKQAFYIAEAGLQRARQALEANTWFGATGSGNAYEENFGAGSYTVTIVDNDDGTYTITSDGYVPNDTTPAAKREAVETNLDVTVTNTNLSLAATATASSSNGTHTADKANDGSNSTYWQASTKGSGEWLKIDLGSSDTLDRIYIRENANITGITLQSSPDNSNWSSLSGLTGDGDDTDKDWTFNFTDTTARYFRATFTASGSGVRVSVDEFETYDTADQTLTIDQGGAFTTTW